MIISNKTNLNILTFYLNTNGLQHFQFLFISRILANAFVRARVLIHNVLQRELTGWHLWANA